MIKYRGAVYRLAVSEAENKRVANATIQNASRAELFDLLEQ